MTPALDSLSPGRRRAAVEAARRTLSKTRATTAARLRREAAALRARAAHYRGVNGSWACTTAEAMVDESLRLDQRATDLLRETPADAAVEAFAERMVGNLGETGVAGALSPAT